MIRVASGRLDRNQRQHSIIPVEPETHSDLLFREGFGNDTEFFPLAVAFDEAVCICTDVAKRL